MRWRTLLPLWVRESREHGAAGAALSSSFSSSTRVVCVRLRGPRLVLASARRPFPQPRGRRLVGGERTTAGSSSLLEESSARRTGLLLGCL